MMAAQNAGPVVVTGATGFVGREVVERLANDGHTVRAAVRRAGRRWPAGVQECLVGEIDGRTDWRAALAGADAVVHCAARAHLLTDEAMDPLAAFRRVNTEGSLALARQAATVGVRRLVFVSSIGVHGAETGERPFHADDVPAPHSPYAQSKLEAETGLRALAADSGLPLVVLRPPLVYGPGAPGNFARLMQAVHRGWPLPLGGVQNRRSLVARANLVDLLIHALHHPAAVGGTWLVSDGEDVSTTELLRRVAKALGRTPRLLPVPGIWLRRLANLTGRAELGQRLFGSLQVDMRRTQDRLQWRPPVTMQQELDAAAQAFLAAAAGGPA